ncbi:MAG: ATP-binding cassette domain-containing protein [Patescibacteria group bacterium]
MSGDILAIQAINLYKSFKDKVAVSNLSLKVKQGEVYSFLGPNGAGKSTTIKMLVTLLDPTSGEIYIQGVNTQQNSMQARLTIGVAMQDSSLDESQTGEEFLILQGKLYGLTDKKIKARLIELQGLIDIGDAMYKQIKTYSGGMKRRLDLAGSIFHKPSVLFLDEPTTGLDPISRAKVWDEVRRLNQELGTTIFLTTQYLEEADSLADRVGIINQGKLSIEGTPTDLKNSIGEDLIIVKAENLTTKVLESVKRLEGVTKADIYGNELTISTTTSAKTIGKVAIELSNSNINIDNLTMRNTTLDDVFLEVTGNRLSSK